MSVESIFLSKSNTLNISTKVGRDVSNNMKVWANKNSLDDYESVHGDLYETLEFANNQFIKTVKNEPCEINMSHGQKYPKYYISDGVEKYDTEDFRSHDAQYSENVMRSNANFRYNNKIKLWNRSAHIRNYDKDEHENGLRDIRELNNTQRGYNMDKIYDKNPYVSSDSLMYDY